MLVEETPVLRILRDKGRITGVETARGTVACEKVVCCTGLWTRHLAATIGVNVPLVPIEHQYMVTDALPALDHRQYCVDR